MFEKNSKATRRLTVSIGVLFVITIASAVFGWHPAASTLISIFTPKPHLIILNVIGAAFDQLDFDRTFATSPECHGLKLSRGSEAPDGAIYMAGMVLPDGWRWSVNGLTFEAPPSDAARTVCALAKHMSANPSP
jgi:hypothetical protein